MVSRRRNNSLTFEPQRQDVRLPSSGGSLFSSSSGSDLLSFYKNRKSVSFHRIEILEFPVELGDHPCVSSGAPIQIGWECSDRNIWAVDQYELLRLRQGKRAKRNVSEKSLSIPADLRRQWLLTTNNYTKEEIQQASEAARRLKESRQRSVKRRDLDGLFWAFERTGRGLRKVASLSSISKGSKTKWVTEAPLSSRVDRRASSPSVEVVPSSQRVQIQRQDDEPQPHNDDTPSTGSSPSAESSESEGPLMF